LTGYRDFVLVSAINVAQTLLREGYFKPTHVRAVENIIKKWRKELTDKGMIKVLQILQDEELNKLR